MLSDPLFRQELVGTFVIIAVAFTLMSIGARLERRRQRLAALPPPTSLREEIHNAFWGGPAGWEIRAAVGLLVAAPFWALILFFA